MDTKPKFEEVCMADVGRPSKEEMYHREKAYRRGFWQAANSCPCHDPAAIVWIAELEKWRYGDCSKMTPPPMPARKRNGGGK
jgi:hypothetical protein